ncbi:MAG: hypothetical protein ACK4WJ_00335 [Endomicrobiia bacterium]
MKIITFKPLLATEKLFSYLEKLNLIKTLKFSKDVLSLKDKDGSVEIIYKTSNKYVSHELICVAKKSVDIKLTVYPENEDLILLKAKNLHPIFFVTKPTKLPMYNLKLNNYEIRLKI